MRRSLAVTAVMSFTLAAATFAGEIPPRPEGLTYPPLVFNVPDSAAMRIKLANGVPAYVVEDQALPLITVQVLLRGGQYLEPSGKEGVASLTGTVWRSGGAGALDAKTLDEELDYLAAQLSTSVGPTTGSVSLNLLAKDIDRGLSLLLDVLRAPRFEADRLAKAKEDLLAEMKRRNDDSADIEQREWDRLVYGEGYWVNRLATKASLDTITREDLLDFHRRLATPANFVVVAAGKFERTAMVAKLNSTLGAWKGGGQGVPAVPQPGVQARPGVYLVDKPDVNQGRVSIGHIGVVRPLPDEGALEVANDILGGGGFTAWMMSRVRSDEGLAYGAYSRYGIGDLYPGAFRAYFQSKSSTCAQAAALTRELIDKIRTQAVGEQELTTSKNAFIERLPRTFETKLKTAVRFGQDELVSREKGYWVRYRDRIKAVDAAAVQRAAQAHIRPDQLAVLVVGNVEEILKGHPDHPEAKLEALGTFVRVPLRDPLTLEPMTK